MSAKNPYDLLGVNHTVTQSELRSAFIRRTKVLHPDRFDPVSQQLEWQMANEMLQELNEAYGKVKEELEQPTSGNGTWMSIRDKLSPVRSGTMEKPSTIFANETLYQLS
jgi:hypothetical protein